MPKSKFFRIAVEGGTTDGRTIERNWLEEMAADYNVETYQARINMEHLRGFSPEPPFNAYGDVLGLETREIELELAGKTEKRLGLYAQVDATDELVGINKKRQKLFTSCEIAPNFAGKGRAYLVGLAVTDSPASLGTEMLAFAAGQGENNPLAGRKQEADNLFTAATELELDVTAETGDEDVPVKGLVALAAQLVAAFKGTAPTPPVVETPPVETPPAPTPPANDNGEALARTFAAIAETVEKSATDTAAAVTALTGRVDELAAKVDATPENLTRRPLASGGNGSVRTDC